MYITIDEADKRPIYRQVAEEIKSLIATGELHEGLALPPVRQVAADLGVNLNTIAQAYRELKKEGLVRVRHGAGAVVVSRIVRDQTDNELRKKLRRALTHLALAGLPKTEIIAIVNEEVAALLKGSRG